MLSKADNSLRIGKVRHGIREILVSIIITKRRSNLFFQLWQMRINTTKRSQELHGVSFKEQGFSGVHYYADILFGYANVLLGVVDCTFKEAC